jgi:hypothetical protein
LKSSFVDGKLRLPLSEIIKLKMMKKKRMDIDLMKRKPQTLLDHLESVKGETQSSCCILFLRKKQQRAYAQDVKPSEAGERERGCGDKIQMTEKETVVG